MYCEKCGNSIEEHDKYCDKCGSLIENIKHAKTGAKMPEQKAWYRLLKVLYIILFILSILIAGVVSIAAIPKKYLDTNLSTIKCDNGKVYSISKNNIFALSSGLTSYEDKNARILCQYDTLDYYNPRYSNQKINLNYAFSPSYVNPDYSSWLAFSLIGFAATWLFLKLIRIGVLYITVGKKPVWKKDIFQCWY